MIKHILLALDGSDHARTAFQYALWLTERLQAELSGRKRAPCVAFEITAPLVSREGGDLEPVDVLALHQLGLRRGGSQRQGNAGAHRQQ